MGILQQPLVVFALGCILVLHGACGVAVPSGSNEWSAGQPGDLSGSYTSRYGYTLAQCKTLCLQETQCNSIDYYHSGSNAQNCYLHRSSVSLGGGSLSPSSSAMYYELTPDLSRAINSLEQRMRNELENGDTQLETDLSSAINNLEERMRNELENGDTQLEKALPPIGSIMQDTGRYSSDNWKVCDGSTISRGPLSGQTTPDMMKWSAGQPGQLDGSYIRHGSLTLAQCKAWCLQETQCMSIDYYHSGSYARRCSKHRSSVSLGHGSLSSSSGAMYYELLSRERYIMRIE